MDLQEPSEVAVTESFTMTSRSKVIVYIAFVVLPLLGLGVGMSLCANSQAVVRPADSPEQVASTTVESDEKVGYYDMNNDGDEGKYIDKNGGVFAGRRILAEKEFVFQEKSGKIIHVCGSRPEGVVGKFFGAGGYVYVCLGENIYLLDWEGKILPVITFTAPTIADVGQLSELDFTTRKRSPDGLWSKDEFAVPNTNATQATLIVSTQHDRCLTSDGVCWMDAGITHTIRFPSLEVVTVPKVHAEYQSQYSAWLQYFIWNPSGTKAAFITNAKTTAPKGLLEGYTLATGQAKVLLETPRNPDQAFPGYAKQVYWTSDDTLVADGKQITF